jgi:hypothetical protein
MLIYAIIFAVIIAGAKITARQITDIDLGSKIIKGVQKKP